MSRSSQSQAAPHESARASEPERRGAKPLLALTGVARSYAATDATDATPVLRDINLQLAAGEAVAIVGPSGSGKSTLLNIIGTLDRPDHGSVQLDGRELTTLHERDLAAVRCREIGLVFQLHHLLPQCTVMENVLVPTLAGGPERRAEAPEERARRLLERVGLSPRLSHRPGQLSGGERQRTAVVRALINEPKLLLADEPTGALDRAAAETLAHLLVELNREESVTLVVVTHAVSLAAQMSRVLSLRDGTLVEETELKVGG
jgi:lipoprotein-releasing system ATP-binding protein